MTTLLWKGEASHGQAEEADLAGQAEEAEGRIGRRWRCAVDGPTRNGGRTYSDRTGSLTVSSIDREQGGFFSEISMTILVRAPGGSGITRDPLGSSKLLNYREICPVTCGDRELPHAETNM